MRQLSFNRPRAVSLVHYTCSKLDRIANWRLSRGKSRGPPKEVVMKSRAWTQNE